jgi:toxin ParE1/3/4
MGQIEENLVSLGLDHRYLVEGKYKIIYFIKENVIYITDVFDCRQDPQKMNR